MHAANAADGAALSGVGWGLSADVSTTNLNGPRAEDLAPLQGAQLSGSVGWAPSRRFLVDLGVSAGPGAGGARAWWGPGARLWLADPSRRVPVASLRLAYGVGHLASLAPMGSLSMALDLPSATALRSRVEAGWLARGALPAAVFVGFGVTRTPRWRAESTQVLAVTADDANDGPSSHQADDGGSADGDRTVGELVVSPPDARVWLPHSVCQWVTVDEANAWLPRLPPGTTLDLRRPGYLPQSASSSGGTYELVKAPVQGALVVAAFPGDQVFIGDEPVVVQRDGTVVSRAPEGVYQVRVVGGGRTFSAEVAVADAHGVWLAAPPVTSQRVIFSAGSAALDEGAQSQIRLIAASIGDVALVVRGTASPEGTPAVNDRLARQRANAVRDALVRAGASPKMVRVGAVEAVDERLPIAQQRAAVLAPDVERGAK